MIVKMKFLSITGPRADIDRVSDVYLSKYEIQLEPALSELKTTKNLIPFMEMNPYKEPFAMAKKFASRLQDKEIEADTSMADQEIVSFIDQINQEYQVIQDQIASLQEEKNVLWDKLQILEPFRSLDFDLKEVSGFQHMQVRFGRIGINDYQKMEKYLYHDINAIFLEGARDDSFVYGCYFVTNKEKNKMASVFNSFHFERIDLPVDCGRTAATACQNLTEQVKEKKRAIKKLKQKRSELLNSHAAQILGAKRRLKELNAYFDVRKMAACTENDNEEYYVLCGWMSEEDVKKFTEETKNDDDIFLVVEDDKDKYFGDPPTKLKNPKIFKPFELFVEMYGLPSANEMDPTIFLALTYTFIFGAMFGDVGQGLCLFLIGGILCLTMKNRLAGIISAAGFFSTIFGFLFGSFFGFENVIEAHWLRPMKAMTDLPFIGQLNTVFVISIAFGMALNLLVMIFQTVSAYKRGDKGELLFSHNGIAGIVFYGFLVLTVVLYMSGHRTPGNILMALCLGIPVLLFLFKEPLTAIVEKRKVELEGGTGMFFVQGFFELFETMLSYFSNTLSYVRIGAFAVSHAAIMEVVLMLSGAFDGGGINWFGVVLGNVVICALEGLIVGIQVLRLEYYELFSRFYKGGGRAFQPFFKIRKKQTN